MVWLSPRTVFIPMFVFQTLNMFNYINTNPPPIVFYFIKTLRITHLEFLPNAFGRAIP